MTRRALVVIVAALLIAPASATALPPKNESIGIVHSNMQGQLINRLAEGTVTDVSNSFGSAGDIPVAGDWDGDGRDGIGVFWTSTGQWFLRNSAAGSGPAESVVAYGTSGDKPFVGDYDGDGRDDIAVFRPSTKWW